MCVLQDFQALTPNLLCRVIETVEGGGCIILFLNSMNELKQLQNVVMNAHKNFRKEGYEMVPRFNERFLLSLLECPGALIVDDELNTLLKDGAA
eukprot:Trichotokara_eunicae@DN8088_c0_g1_i1.p1